MRRHDIETRRLAADLMDGGMGPSTLARALAIPHSTAEKWCCMRRAVGRKVFLEMGSTHRKYDYETKLAAVLDVVEGGRTLPDAMERHGVASLTALRNWVRAYREEGPEALRPKGRGRPAGPAELTREQELEAENRRLRAEVAYLKKLRALRLGEWVPGESPR